MLLTYHIFRGLEGALLFAQENAILLQKMVRIKEQDTRAVFRPWTARSTFQWKAGHYYDAATNTKTLDHINLTSSVSPRSIHYFALTRPGTAPPDVTARLRDMEVQVCLSQYENIRVPRSLGSCRVGCSQFHCPFPLPSLVPNWLVCGSIRGLSSMRLS